MYLIEIFVSPRLSMPAFPLTGGPQEYLMNHGVLLQQQHLQQFTRAPGPFRCGLPFTAPINPPPFPLNGHTLSASMILDAPKFLLVSSWMYRVKVGSGAQLYLSPGDDPTLFELLLTGTKDQLDLAQHLLNIILNQ